MKFPLDQADAISVQQIRTYCTVVECGGYAGAQQQIGLATPTMWEQVKALEKRYRTKLFERVGRNIRTTPTGQTLYQMYKPILANLDSTFEIVAEQTEGISGEVRVCTGVRMMLEELGTVFGQFHQKFPDVRLRLSTGGDRVAQQSVLDGKDDLALLIEPPPNVLSKSLKVERLYPIEFMAILPRKHRLCKVEHLKLHELINFPLVVGNQNSVGRMALEEALHRLSLGPARIVCETDTSAVTAACVRANMGVGFVAGIPGQVNTPGLIARSLAEEVGRVHVVAIYKLGRQLTRVLCELLEMLRMNS
ncbi:MAG: LysR family transcriptional regulator [Planctomycetales bacterium]|nr:LysR family transcriptional regulator [Planctomycetales bacterium]